MSKLHEDGLGGKGLTINAFAERYGLRISYVRQLCREGKISEAKLHPGTKQWWIYAPAKLLCGSKNLQGNTSTLMRSTLRGVKQA